MAKLIRYNLREFNDIAFNGFDFELSQEIVDTISNLALQVGSPNYVKTPIFQKRENNIKIDTFTKDNTLKKKKGNKNIEIINDEDWENIRTFQTTKIEQKVGIDAQVDIIRSYLNKMTDKNYIDIRNKIIDTVEQIMKENSENVDIDRVSANIFEIASTNRFYSKIYADLYSDLINNYESMKNVFEINFNKFIDLFGNIEYIDPNVDYDKFCKNNKDNEKRRALSSFFMNLMKNNIIERVKIVQLLKKLIIQLFNCINEDNKKNEVDEITENIAILYSNDLFEEINEDEYNINIDGMNITSFIHKLANSKVKDYKSLTNKSIFKFMDLI
jgi:hypothetical protein